VHQYPKWTKFEDGTIRVRYRSNETAYVHTDRSILRFGPPGDNTRARHYYHGPLGTGEDGEGDPLTIKYEDGVSRRLVYPAGTPIEELPRTQPISEVWLNPHGEELPPQDPQQYPFDEPFRPPPPPPEANVPWPWPY